MTTICELVKHNNIIAEDASTQSIIWYIWEPLLEIVENNNPVWQIIYKPTHSGSAYCEVSKSKVVEKKMYCEVNPLYRFQEIFAQMSESNILESEESSDLKLLFDPAVNFLAGLDLLSGINLKAYQSEEFKLLILKGAFGSKNKELFAAFSEKEKNKISDGLIGLYRGKNSFAVFLGVIKSFFHRFAFLQKNNSANYILLVNVPLKKKKATLAKLELIKSIFWDINFGLVFYLGKHFTILEDKEKSKIGFMEIF